jgi:predicted RNA-binding protein with RPS1 domain
MKKILTDLNGGIFGAFTNVEKVDNGYLCDGTSYQTLVTGEVTVSEVADDYVHPDTLNAPEVVTKKTLTLEDLQAQIDALKGAV